ncbi:hypothetical protein L1787_16490 [Acuticoccus sp. M5D2P5]|uniref:hypothetical protein n=1 Tax=Acuticoccus kalidii TaxID=2910977 RepID=UPI001F22C7DD|nr:hypothetical protein [Acuticoccus kalidii]MCF3935004.1 hypothetical protein [Acuticoccus kalidii]
MDRIATISSAQKISTEFLNNIGAFGREGLDRVGAQAVGTGLYWADFTIQRVSNLQATLTLGSFWSGGKVYPLRTEHTFDFDNDLPQAGGNKRIVTICVSANQAPAGNAPREFLKDPTNDLVTTESRSTATRDDRFAAAAALYSDPSPSPTAPAAPGGQVAIGWITLTTAGLEDETGITLNTSRRLPSNESLASSVNQMQARQNQVFGRVDSLETDLSNTINQLDALPGPITFRQVFRDLAELKDVVDVPDTAAAYYIENFRDESGSNTTHPDYAARIDDGATFPPPASNGSVTSKFALFAANDPLVKTVDNLTLPYWEEELRIDVVGRDADVSFSDKQSHTIHWRHLRCGRIRHRWGSAYKTPHPASLLVSYLTSGYFALWRKALDSNWHPDYDVWESRLSLIERRRLAKVQRRKRWWKDWARFVYHPWHYVETGVAGRNIAQTFLSSSAGYVPKIGLYFAAKGSGDVTVQICETVDGVPNTEAVVATTTISSGSINLWPARTDVPFKPTLLEPGMQYAVVLTTDASHSLACVSGNKYLQGSLQTANDGVWSDINPNLDLAIQIYYCRFAQTRTVVQLAPLSLPGGILSVDSNIGAIEPEGTSLMLSYQPNGSGAWYPIDNAENSDPLGSLPTVLNMRAIFTGTTDLMPAIDFTDADYEAWRPDDELTWISNDVDFGQTVTTVVIEVTCANFDGSDHDITVTLLPDGGGSETADASDSEVDPADPTKITFFRTFTGVSLQVCQIKVEGTTTDTTNIYALQKVFTYGSS